MVITINYVNNLPIKYVHDLIMDNVGCNLEFILEEDVDMYNFIVFTDIINLFLEDQVSNKTLFVNTNKKTPFGTFSGFDKVFINGKEWEKNINLEYLLKE